MTTDSTPTVKVDPLLKALLELYVAAKKCDPALTDMALEEPGFSIARAVERVTDAIRSAQEKP